MPHELRFLAMMPPHLACSELLRRYPALLAARRSPSIAYRTAVSNWILASG
jgi:hypothetical protein